MLDSFRWFVLAELSDEQILGVKKPRHSVIIHMQFHVLLSASPTHESPNETRQEKRKTDRKKEDKSRQFEIRPLISPAPDFNSPSTLVSFIFLKLFDILLRHLK